MAVVPANNDITASRTNNDGGESRIENRQKRKNGRL